MLYVVQEQRDKIDSKINALVEAIDDLMYSPAALKGVANYTITRLLLKVMKPASGWNYSAICDLMGTMTCSQQELYRRLAGPYEDKAIARNGDVTEFVT